MSQVHDEIALPRGDILSMKILRTGLGQIYAKL